MKTLRGLLESLVKSGAWGSLQEGSSTKAFRQAEMIQRDTREENKRISIGVGEEIRRGQAAKRQAAAREEAAKKKAAGEVAAKKQKQHAKRHEETLKVIRGMKHGDVGAVIIRDRKTGGKAKTGGKEHFIVNHEGNFLLVGPGGIAREVSSEFGSVVNGAVNLTSKPKGRGNAKIIAQVEASARRGGVEGIDPEGKKENKYSYVRLPGGRFVIKSKIPGG